MNIKEVYNKLKVLNKFDDSEYLCADEYESKDISFNDTINAILIIDYPFYEYDENGKFQSTKYKSKIEFSSLHTLFARVRDAISDIFESGMFYYSSHCLEELFLEGFSVKRIKNEVYIYPYIGS